MSGQGATAVEATIRRATPDDASTLSSLAARAFTESFGHLYPPEDLAAFIASSYSADAHRAYLTDPNCAMWIAEKDGDAVGYVLAGSPCTLPSDAIAPEDGELKRLYLLPSAQNGGLGGRLFTTALDWLERDGPRTLWIGVWSQNFGAQRFYGRHGFEKVGNYEFLVGSVRDPEFILRRGADASPKRARA